LLGGKPMLICLAVTIAACDPYIRPERGPLQAAAQEPPFRKHARESALTSLGALLFHSVIGLGRAELKASSVAAASHQLNIALRRAPDRPRLRTVSARRIAVNIAILDRPARSTDFRRPVAAIND